MYHLPSTLSIVELFYQSGKETLKMVRVILGKRALRLFGNKNSTREYTIQLGWEIPEEQETQIYVRGFLDALTNLGYKWHFVEEDLYSITQEFGGEDIEVYRLVIIRDLRAGLDSYADTTKEI